MSYSAFHLVFTLPVVAVLWAFRPRGGPWWPLAALVAIAFVYTTPWDNLLVALGVWSYPPGAVWGTIGWVPIEEYAFFVLQTLITGLGFMWLRARLAPRVPAPISRRARLPGVALFGALSVIGWVLIARGGHGLYLGLVLGWACPVLTGMWAIGGEMLWPRRWLMVWAITLPTLYLCIADRIAIQLGIWHITDATRTGVDLLGLPVEEAFFFLVTNMMIVHGLVLSEPSPASVIPALRRQAAAAL